MSQRCNCLISKAWGGGRGRTRTCDLLRVKNRHLFQMLHQFYPSIPVFIHLGNLLRSQTYIVDPMDRRVLAQF
jgi:hypothetical protein